MPSLRPLFERLGRPVPDALADWEARHDLWCEQYSERCPTAALSEITLDFAIFVFDHCQERVALAYAISVEQLNVRDVGRMKGFPDVNATVRRILGDRAFPADRGHFLGHASGGVLDINLFPHQRRLNRGWSLEGKRFREMERFVAQNPGTFFYHRPVYDDETWVPAQLEYGVLRAHATWWVDMFHNKPLAAPPAG